MKKWLWMLMLSVATVSWAQEEPPLIDLAAEVAPSTAESEAQKTEAEAEKKAIDAINDEVQVKFDAMMGEDDAKKQAKTAVAVKTGPAEWGYLDQIAPRFWSQLDTAYALCGTGMSQSPINLRDDQAINTDGLPALDIAYREVPYRVKHTKHGLQVDYPLGSYIRLGDKRYELIHYVFRTPSEHQLEGFAYPMEIQLVHRNGDGEHAVISVIVREGKVNAHLNTILNNLPTERDKMQVFEKVEFNPARFLPANKLFYRYVGSLTTPPCTEGTVWIVFKQPIEASVAQLVKMNELMGNNARPLQSLQGRLPLKSWSDKSDSDNNRSMDNYYNIH